MTTTERLLSATILAGLAAWGYQSWVAQPENRRQAYEARKAEDSKRFEQWAYVAREKEIAPGEIIRLAVIPHPTGLEIMDTKCLIYTNREFKTSNMICPDAKQGDIEVAE